MLQLYGHPLSDYATKIKIALLYKNVDFEEVKQSPSQDEKYVEFSYTGRIPVLNTEHGVIAESSAIIEYINESYSEPSLLPGDHFQRAMIRQCAAIVENYIDLPARRVYTKYVAGSQFSELDIESAKKDIQKAVTALNRMNAFQDHAIGNSFTFADCSAMAVLPLVKDYMNHLIQFDFSAGLNHYEQYYETMLQKYEFLQKIEKQRIGAVKALIRVRSSGRG